MASPSRRVAVLGNPNVGKSTLFTALTHRISHIANWPGTTVEYKEAVLSLGEEEVTLVDLPGIYTLSGTSVEEAIARDYLLKGGWDALMILVDSLSPERTLYLAVHALEFTGRALIVLTKWDAAHGKGVHIHVDRLERILGVPVVAVSAVTGEGVYELRRRLRELLEAPAGGQPLRVDYGQLEPAIAELAEALESRGLGLPARWLAIKLLEGDEHIEGIVGEEVAAKARELRETLARVIGRDPSEVIISTRFSFVDRLCREIVVRRSVAARLGPVERVLLTPLGAPISLAVLLCLYMAAFTINTGFPLNIILGAAGMAELAEALESYTLSGLLSAAFDALAAAVAASPAPEPLKSALARGIVPGLGSVLSLYPLILTTVFILALLEDSGVGPYMAVSLHRLFRHLGLSGRAVYPVLIALGCNVPAVTASRTSLEEVERRQLIFSVPIIPCQAALIVVIAIVSAHFQSPLTRAAALVTVYAAAFALLALTSRAVRRLAGIRDKPELVLELPPLHKPSLKVLWWISWDYSKHFLKKAGGIIFAAATLIWLLVGYGPQGLAASPQDSFAYMAGRLIAPLLYPLGIRGGAAASLGFALLAGLVAKEVFLSSLAMLAGTADPVEAIRALGLSKGQAVAVGMMTALYTPCVATIAEIYRESGSARWTALYLLYVLASSYLVSLLAGLAAGLLLAG